MADNRPIGILDSGIGGLTTARAVNRILPLEQIVFFGDTAHFPYGDKSARAIQHYVHRITDFLIERDAKMILIACNSASSAAYLTLNREVGKSYPVINVIDPIVEYIVRRKKYNSIGIIGTKRTIASRAYQRKFKSAAPDIAVKAMATPLLAPMIEEGFFNNTISQTIIDAYLSNTKLKGIQAIILACTHYPLIKAQIEKYYSLNKLKVDVIDSSDVVAEYTRDILRDNDMLADSGSSKNEHSFCVSDFTNSFQSTASMFFGGTVKLQECDIWD